MNQTIFAKGAARSLILARLDALRKDKKIKRLTAIGVALVAVGSISAMLHDIEYVGQDISQSGAGIFAWRSPLCVSKIDFKREPLFAHGLDSLQPDVIHQGKVYDCRFISTVGSYCATEAGRSALFSSIKERVDGNYSVLLPGAVAPLVVAPLTAAEKHYYAHAYSGEHKKSAGVWLPVLEKAYGQYRNQNQDIAWQLRRLVKHAIFEGRLTATSMLPGFGAAFGATDDVAAVAVAGRKLKELNTFSFECGDNGFGKGYATFRQLHSWVARREVFNNFIKEQDLALRQGQTSGLLAIATTELNGNCEAYGLNPAHAYSVIDYATKGEMLTLRDPYGGDDKTPGAGTFQINLHDFNLLFSHLRVAEGGKHATLPVY